MGGSGIAEYGGSEKAEVLLARVFKEELGVEINEQALRIFVRTKWDRISKLAHIIHNGGR